jgi:hypothetical protein
LLFSFLKQAGNIAGLGNLGQVNLGLDFRWSVALARGGRTGFGRKMPSDLFCFVLFNRRRMGLLFCYTQFG